MVKSESLKRAKLKEKHGAHCEEGNTRLFKGITKILKKVVTKLIENRKNMGCRMS